MNPTSLAVCLLRCALTRYGWGGGAEKRGSYRVVRVPLFKGVVYGVDGLGRLEVERVVV